MVFADVAFSSAVVSGASASPSKWFTVYVGPRAEAVIHRLRPGHTYVTRLRRLRVPALALLAAHTRAQRASSSSSSGSVNDSPSPGLAEELEGIAMAFGHAGGHTCAPSSCCRAIVPSAWTTPVTFNTEPAPAFVWDAVNCGPCVSVTNAGLTTTFDGSESWSMVLANTGFATGRNKWAIRIDRSPTAYLFVGVAGTAANQSSFLGSDSHGWGFIGDKALYHKRDRVRSYGERFGQGDVVGVELDMDKGTVSFSRNGQDLGVAFRGLTGELYPAVAFYNMGQRVTLVKEEFQCPGAGVPVPGAPSHVTPAEVVRMTRVLRCMVQNSRLALAPTAAAAAAAVAAVTHTQLPCELAALPREFLVAAWRHFVAWRTGHLRRYVTQSGFEVTFDASEAACRRFGVLSGDRVMTQRGEGEVIGVWDCKVWLHVDGDIGAWYMHCKPLPLHPHSRSLAAVSTSASTTAVPSTTSTSAAVVAALPLASLAVNNSDAAEVDRSVRDSDQKTAEADVVEREEKDGSADDTPVGTDVVDSEQANTRHANGVFLPYFPIRVDKDKNPTPLSPGTGSRSLLPITGVGRGYLSSLLQRAPLVHAFGCFLGGLIARCVLSVPLSLSLSLCTSHVPCLDFSAAPRFDSLPAQGA